VTNSLKGLAGANPDNFLYMFRNAFGQEQPRGAEAPGGWDSQQTKLRGHATGHYLSALSPRRMPVPAMMNHSRAKFADRMEYMVNTLYELSQIVRKARNSRRRLYVSDPAAVCRRVPASQAIDSDLRADWHPYRLLELGQRVCQRLSP
jgi:uncharacterized protein